jgi:steroid delta-isomerase-like uncharacterized protein
VSLVTKEHKMDKQYQMTPEERNLGHRSHMEWLGKGDMDVVYEIFAQDCDVHSRYIPPELSHGIEGFKNYATFLRGAFPDLEVTDEDMVAEGDRVAMRWSFVGTHEGVFWGIPPTGKRVTMTGFDIFRVRDGKIQELWVESDYLTLMQQLSAAG